MSSFIDFFTFWCPRYHNSFACRKKQTRRFDAQHEISNNKVIEKDEFQIFLKIISAMRKKPLIYSMSSHSLKNSHNKEIRKILFHTIFDPLMIVFIFYEWIIRLEQLKKNYICNLLH